MEEDTEYLKLPIEDQCVHKSWKARENGYKECAKLFSTITEEKSPEFTKFAPLIKKFVTDSNAAAQEKALDAVLAFVENAHIAGKTTGDAVAGIVAKCFTSPKRTAQERAVDVLLMYCEIEKQDIVIEELIKGFGQKNPKVVCGSVKAATSILREFGSKAIAIKPLVKCIVRLFEDKDKNVREEGKKMVIEMYRWVGSAIQPQLSGLKPIQIQELEAEFEKLPKEKAVPTRYLRSQQEQKVKAQGQDEQDGEEAEEEEEEEIDPLDLMSPVNILDNLPKDFYEKAEAKKWQDRKEAMEGLLPLSQNPKLEAGDYAELVKVLKKIIGKDTNVMIVALAGQCVCGIAKGLKTRFAPYSNACLETIFEKFKEKKVNVVSALRDAVDAIFQSTTADAIQETACAALNNKNPSVKAETAAFLARAFCYCTPQALPKKLLKAYVVELLKTLNESDPNVRDGSAQALGTLQKVVGEKNLAPFLVDVDALKMQKITEFCEKAEIKVKAKPVKAKSAPSPTDEDEKPIAGPKKIRGGAPAKTARPPPSKAKKPAAFGSSNGLDSCNDDDEPAKPSVNPRTNQAKSRIASNRTAAPKSATSKIGVTKTAVRPKIGSARTAVSRKEEAVDTSPLLQENALKQQRAMDELRMKTLRWEFSTPRPEFVLQLQDQMTKACMNQNLYNNMFHKDFKFHLKAIDSLTENLNENPEPCIANLDLILRWLTLRFFDTNPSVILRAMDYLTSVFSVLSARDYVMSDFEAKAFLPFLVNKMGDPKDAIRGPTKNIVRLMCDIYSSNKVLPFIIEGLSSKNARQRAECLETIGSFVEVFGMTVCHPSPQAMAKEVVKHVADRDKSVRNAALNCLLQVYFREGEKMYKMLGIISEKDRSLIEERIKRFSKNRPVVSKPQTAPEPTSVVKPASAGVPKGVNRVIPAPATQPAPLLRNRNAPNTSSSGTNLDENENSSAGPEKRFNLRPLSADVGSTKSRIQIDYDRFDRLLSSNNILETDKYKIEEIPDLDDIMNEKETLCPKVKSRSANFEFVPSNVNANNVNLNSEEASQAINSVISQVTSTDVSVVSSALSELNTVIQASEKRMYLTRHVDQFLVVIGFQYRHILNTKMADSTLDKNDCIRIYRYLTACLMNLIKVPELAAKASTDVLRDLVHVCLNIILDTRLADIEDSSPLIRALNVLVFSIIQKANFTSIFSALLKLLNDSVRNSGNVRYQELVMKCNWKAIQLLPNKASELNPVQILQDIHDFMKAYPSNTWSERSSTTPLQTIKTVLHQLNKVYKEDILKHMAQVPNSADSECHKYILKDLKRKSEKTKENCPNINQGQISTPSSKSLDLSGTTPPKNLPKALTESLCEIFTIIGEKERTKEGLRRLYDFKQSHPEADINACLSNASQHFKNYIERGLNRVELERQKAEDVPPVLSKCEIQSNKTATSPASADVLVLDNLVDEFKEMAAQAGFDNAYIDTAVKGIIKR